MLFQIYHCVHAGVFGIHDAGNLERSQTAETQRARERLELVGDNQFANRKQLELVVPLQQIIGQQT